MKVMLKSLFIRLTGVMVMLLAAGEIYGQQAAITIIDAKTKEPVPYATVCFGDLKSKSIKYLVTDMAGKVANDVKEPSKVTVTFVGYVTLVDSIKRGVSKTLLLVPSVFEMDEVVITAQYAPEKADKSIYKINVINSRQIEQKAATNLTDLLSSESNMRVAQGGVLGTSLSLQGLSGENVKFLLDGVPIVGRLNGNIDLNQLNLYNVDHIEIIEGPMRTSNLLEFTISVQEVRFIGKRIISHSIWHVISLMAILQTTQYGRCNGNRNCSIMQMPIICIRVLKQGQKYHFSISTR